MKKFIIVIAFLLTFASFNGSEAGDYMFDLGLDSYDIYFSNNRPVAGENIRIFADINNYGQRSSFANISFFNGNSQIGPTKRIYVPSEEKKTVAVDWEIPKESFNIKVTLTDMSAPDENLLNNEAIGELVIPEQPMIKLALADLSDNNFKLQGELPDINNSALPEKDVLGKDELSGPKEIEPSSTKMKMALINKEEIVNRLKEQLMKEVQPIEFIRPARASYAPPIEASIEYKKTGETSYSFFAKTGKEGNYSYSWYIGKGQTVNGRDIEVDFGEKGVRKIILTVKDNLGNEGSAEIVIANVDLPRSSPFVYLRYLSGLAIVGGMLYMVRKWS